MDSQDSDRNMSFGPNACNASPSVVLACGRYTWASVRLRFDALAAARLEGSPYTALRVQKRCWDCLLAAAGRRQRPLDEVHTDGRLTRRRPIGTDAIFVRSCVLVLMGSHLKHVRLWQDLWYRQPRPLVGWLYCG